MDMLSTDCCHLLTLPFASIFNAVLLLYVTTASLNILTYDMVMSDAN